MHRSKRPVITIMITIHPSLCSLAPNALEVWRLIPWIICGHRRHIFNLKPAAPFWSFKETSAFNNRDGSFFYSLSGFCDKDCQQNLFLNTRWLRASSQTTSFFPSTNSWRFVSKPDVWVIRSSSVVCIQSSLLVSITVKTLQTHLRTPFSRVPQITSCKSSKSRMCVIEEPQCSFFISQNTIRDNTVGDLMWGL